MSSFSGPSMKPLGIFKKPFKSQKLRLYLCTGIYYLVFLVIFPLTYWLLNYIQEIYPSVKTFLLFQHLTFLIVPTSFSQSLYNENIIERWLFFFFFTQQVFSFFFFYFSCRYKYILFLISVMTSAYFLLNSPD